MLAGVELMPYLENKPSILDSFVQRGAAKLGELRVLAPHFAQPLLLLVLPLIVLVQPLLVPLLCQDGLSLNFDGSTLRTGFALQRRD